MCILLQAGGNGKGKRSRPDHLPPRRRGTMHDLDRIDRIEQKERKGLIVVITGPGMGIDPQPGIEY
ncbi:MAG TPA: hypothetical protein VHN12_13540 [Geobacteraceae bacterium]|nr:hypothetical protein [Geobacteraceae bacterium]